MSTQSNAVTESAIARPAAAVTAISPWRRFYWSVRREVWENRSLYVAPAAVSAFMILGLLIGVAHGTWSVTMTVTTDSGTAHQQPNVTTLYDIASAAIMGVALVVAAFYCLGTLHGERRDRSILFWKSLPVSDTTAVLGKAAIPFVVLPAVMLALTVLTHLLILLILSVALPAHGGSLAEAWPTPGLPQVWGMTFFHIVAIHVLWYAPIYGYMLMVSAWARRAPFLWAVVPPVVVGIVEKIAFNTSYVFHLLGDRLSGESSGVVGGSGGMKMDSMQQMDVLRFASSPGLWIGLAFAAIFLFATVRLRRAKGLI